MNKCLVCGNEVSGNNKTCSPKCRTTYGNRIKGENNLRKYNENPNCCLNCGKPILHKDGDVLKNTQAKKFCNKSCSAIYNNSKNKLTYIDRECKRCHKSFRITERNKSGYFSNKIICDQCKKDVEYWEIANLTLGELMLRSKNWQSARSSVCKHARYIYKQYNKENVCKICGYDKHVDIAHIKAVSDFDKDTKIKDINSSDNLVALCPNHHWEYDHGIANL